MSERLPAVSGEDVVQALGRAGFVVICIKGSHHIIEHETDHARRTVVPGDRHSAYARMVVEDTALTTFLRA